jgi:glycosyltransferase 2 family protein
MGRQVWRRIRPVAGVAILAVLVWRIGTGPVWHGLGSIDAPALLAALALTAVTTVASALRWRAVSHALGVKLALPQAVAAYYRSQLLNSTLPGGVVGDVHRAVRHGRASADLGRGARSVVWERCAGQVVQVVIAGVVLLSWPSPFRHVAAITVAIAAVVVAVLVAVVFAFPGGRRRSRLAGAIRTARSEIRALLRQDCWPTLVGTSVVVVAGHAAVFLVAAHTADTGASTARLLPVAMLVLLASSVPLNVGGWGPREGVAAWAFATVGFGAAAGLATATVFGILSVVATLPGAAVLAAGALSRKRIEATPEAQPRERESVTHG